MIRSDYSNCVMLYCKLGSSVIGNQAKSFRRLKNMFALAQAIHLCNSLLEIFNC